MANLHGFDANTVEPSSDRSAIPPGRYAAVITATEMKPTKSGNGKYLEFEFQIVDGEHKGRKLWDRLNLENPNGTAVQIARSTLSAICRSVGVPRPNDSSELHSVPLCVSVKLRKFEGNDTNEISGYDKIESLAANLYSRPIGNDDPAAEGLKAAKEQAPWA
jgi:hypothetical protein